MDRHQSRAGPDSDPNGIIQLSVTQNQAKHASSHYGVQEVHDADSIVLIAVVIIIIVFFIVAATFPLP